MCVFITQLWRDKLRAAFGNFLKKMVFEPAAAAAEEEETSRGPRTGPDLLPSDCRSVDIFQSEVWSAQGGAAWFRFYSCDSFTLPCSRTTPPTTLFNYTPHLGGCLPTGSLSPPYFLWHFPALCWQELASSCVAPIMETPLISVRDTPKRAILKRQFYAFI